MNAATWSRLTLMLLVVSLFTAIAGFVQNGEDSGSEYLSPIEKAIVQEVNVARTEPRKYATFVEEVRRNYDGKRLIRSGDIPLVT